MTRRRKIVFASVLLGSAAAAGYFGYLVHATSKLYTFIKSDKRGWSGIVHCADPLLGYVPIAGSRGAHTVPLGPDIPMRYDDDGFRVPVRGEPIPTDARPLVLALGCSFTYGDCCRAEDAFPYLVQQKIGGRTLNAGVCGYGLAGMVLRGRRLIPRYRPDVVLVEYAPWLATRSQQPLGDSYYGCNPMPFYVLAEPVDGRADGGELAIHPPVFPAKLFESPIREYRGTASGPLDFLDFLFRVGIPLTTHDNVYMALYRFRMVTGLTPRPVSDRAAVMRSAYGELYKICHDNGARMMVVLLGKRNATVEQDVGIIRGLADIVVVDAEAALRTALAEPGEDAYRRAYAHWRGDPPRVVDIHPNPAAHRIIADTITAALNRKSLVESHALRASTLDSHPKLAAQR